LGLSGGAIPLQRRWGEEIAILKAVKGGARDSNLVELAAAIERDVSSGSDIGTMRQLDRTIKTILARGDSLVLFPEGRLGKTEGKLLWPLQRGTARYALQAGIPIIPIALVGTNNLYWRKKLTVRWGKPLSFPQQQHPGRQDLERVTAALQQALEELLPADYQEPDELKLFSYFLNHMFW
jgi:1-acyl-sn-glycerol-3-phosphate acyltransferase